MFRPRLPRRRLRGSHPIRGSTPQSILVAIAIAALALVLPGFAATAGAQDAAAEPQASLPDIEDEVMCPVCGTLLELAAEAPQAQRQRAFIRELIAQGYTKDEIKDALVAEFGEEVLATPDTEGFDLAAWLVPAAALLGGAVAIAVGLRRWRADGGDGPGGRGGGGPGADPLSRGDTEKLDADLERYEL